MIFVGMHAPAPKVLKCDKCDGHMAHTPTWEEWQESGKPLLCENCWPPVKETK